MDKNNVFDPRMENAACQATTPCEPIDRVKARVQEELGDLCVKISKLSTFLFGDGVMNAKLSMDMVCAMHEQLRIMQEYAKILQRRLIIWGKTDEELHSDDKCCRPMAY